MAGTAEQPRQVPPEQALPEPGLGASAVIAGSPPVTALAGTRVGTLAGLAATAPGVPLLKAHWESVEAILEALRQFFVLWRARSEKWVVGRGRRAQRNGVILADGEIMAVVANEAAFQAEFERKAKERVRVEALRIAQLPATERDDALGKLLTRERLYARMRSEAMAKRALAGLDRAVLKIESPLGAGWELGEVENHTPDCVAMAGKVWPWEVLEEFHPPTHPGCACKLRERQKGERVVPLAEAKIKVAAARALLHEEEVQELMEAAVRTGLVPDRDSFIAAWMEAAS